MLKTIKHGKHFNNPIFENGRLPLPNYCESKRLVKTWIQKSTKSLLDNDSFLFKTLWYTSAKMIQLPLTSWFICQGHDLDLSAGLLYQLIYLAWPLATCLPAENLKAVSCLELHLLQVYQNGKFRSLWKKKRVIQNLYYLLKEAKYCDFYYYFSSGWFD